MSYLGNSPGLVTQRLVNTFTATASQTTFTTTSTYVVGYVDVYVNGVKLNTADFVASSGSTVVLAEPCVSGDIVDILLYFPRALTDGYTKPEADLLFQPLDGDLTSIAGLEGTSGFLKKSNANTWTLDTNNYLTSFTEADTLSTVTGRGATTTTAVSITNSTSSTNTSTGALIITGGLGIAENLNVGGNLTLTGNLTVNGTTTTINSTTITVDDILIELGDVATPTDTTANNGGILLKGATNKTILWVQSTGRWTSNQPLEAASLQNTPIGTTTTSSGAFTSLSASGGVTLTQNTASTSTTSGTLVVTGGLGISGDLYTGNIKSNSNTNLQLTPGGTGLVVLNTAGTVKALLETATVSATAATGTINYDAATQAVLYYTSNATANWTLNLRGSSTLSLNTMMAIGQSLTVAFLVQQGGTAYYPTALQVDGTSITPKWQGGTTPTSGNTNSIDVYTYTVIKTANATYTALASQTKFA